MQLQPESLSDHSETAQIKSSPQTKPAKSAISKKLLKLRPQKVGIQEGRPIPEPKTETHEYEPNSILAFISFIVGVIGLSLIIIGIPAISLAYLIFALGLTLAIVFGIISFTKIKKQPELKGRALAVISVVLSFIFLALMTVLFLSIIVD